MLTTSMKSVFLLALFAIASQGQVPLTADPTTTKDPMLVDPTTEAPSTETAGSYTDSSNVIVPPASGSENTSESATGSNDVSPSGSGMGSMAGGSNMTYPDSSSASIMAISAASACAVFVAIA
jgi:hypothetical protein